MGRIVNLFDLSAGMAGNRLLAEIAHQDGSPVHRNRSDVAKALDPIKYHIEDESIGYESRRTYSSKKSSGTPIKMLMAQEMSKETESKHKPPSVVAKLMGLDALPAKQLNSTAQGSLPRGSPGYAYTQQGTLSTYQHQAMGFLDKPIQHGVHQLEGQREYKDVYEVWLQSPRKNYVRDKSLMKGKHNDNLNEKKMALVRQKFIEAKRLATDEKLRQTKEFQDTLEVLSSNKDILLKFLQEPNFLFSQELYELQSIPPPPQTNRITVLKPSKTVENNRHAGPEKHERQTRKQTQVTEANGWDKDRHSWSSVFSNQKDDSSAQPMQIVVLKPSPGKTYDVRTIGSSPTSPPRMPSNKDYYGELEDDEAQGSREVAKEITQQMHESLSGHHRNETFLSSMVSNGYVGDESSLNRSENGYVEGNLSDSEVMIPTSRHSWDYINRFGSPFSSSSFSRASCSPESSVCREAKKRLSERWALMASNGNGPEQRQVQRSSSTLGEMLALSDSKKTARSGEEYCDGSQIVLSGKSCGGEEDTMEPTAGGSTNRNKVESEEVSLGNLVRSRSVPVSSTVYGSSLNVEVPDPKVDKSIVPKEEMKSKSGKSSFKGKVSSLFFSRSKKTSKGKSSTCFVAGSQDESPSSPSEVPSVLNPLSPQNTSHIVSHFVTDSVSEGDLSSKSSSPAICVGEKEGTFSNEALLSISSPGMPIENQDQPSPISVLEAPFEDDASATPQPSEHVMSDHHGQPVHHYSLKSDLIDKSPPIESITRTLSWDDTCLLSTAPNPLNQSRFSPKAEEEEEQHLFVCTLLSAAGLDHEEQSGALFTRWHSPDSLLDPSLVDKIFKLRDEKAPLHESKRRQRRSNQRLLFDCVNAALVDIMGYGTDASPWAKAAYVTKNTHSVRSSVTVDEVWVRVKKLFSNERRCFSGENGDDNNSLVVETMVRKEVVGKGWEELMRLEMNALGENFEADMLEELVDEALVELTGGF